MNLSNKVYNAQINNLSTYLLYKNQCVSLAENVFNIGNIDDEDMIDMSFVNKELLRTGSIAWFKDDVLGLLALPYVNLGILDLYGRPTKIMVKGQNGYCAILENNTKKKEFVIMYDNNERVSIYKDILQYADRIALNTRVCDINITQQRTPRIWKTSSDKVKSMEDMLKNIDNNVDSVMAYQDLDLDDSDCVLAPAPYVADQIDIHNEKIWNEFLRFIGIANLTVQKKERNIKDEIRASQGGTIASRNSRYKPRLDAITKINKYFGYNLTIEFYDGVPSNEEIEVKKQNGNEVDDNVFND